MLTFANLIPDNSTRILDLGCNASDILSNFKQHCNKDHLELIGVESAYSQNKKMLDIYTRKCEIDLDKTTELPFPQEYFNCIICLNMLQKMANPDNFLSMFVKPYLLSGGAFILSVPNILHNSFIINLFCKGRFKGSLVSSDASDLRFFSIFEIVELLARNGFEVDTKINCMVSPENSEMDEFYSDLNNLVYMNDDNNNKILGRVVCFVLKCNKVNSLDPLQPILWNNYRLFTTPYDANEEVCVVS